jgi:hypothetical protein
VCMEFPSKFHPGIVGDGKALVTRNTSIQNQSRLGRLL